MAAQSRKRPKKPAPKRTRKVVFTQKHERFVREYLVDYNALQAAHRAGYSKNDHAAGFRCMQHPVIRARVQEALKEVFARIDITADDVRQGFIQIAFDARTEPQGGPTRVERMMALDRLAKMFGLYKVERPGEIGKTLEQLLNDASVVETQIGPAQAPARLRLIDGGRT